MNNNNSFKIRVQRQSVSEAVTVSPIDKKEANAFHITIGNDEEFDIYRSENGKWVLYSEAPHLLEEGLVEKIGEAIDNKE